MSHDEIGFDWNEIDTVLLDMDGTLLDLAFDNYFWLELVPEAYGRRHGLEFQAARAELVARYESVAGQLSWYCLDHWTTELGLEIRDLKWRHRHLIAFLPGVVDVLRWMKRSGKTLIIVTNAHPDTLAVKLHQTRLDCLVDAIAISHHFGFAKEDAAFWRRLAEVHPFDANRTALLEDSLAVLETARSFGLSRTLAVRRPDSRKPPREMGGLPAIDGLVELASGLT
jgi:HAD superfamily hydrolase (TIGR01509 family)